MDVQKSITEIAHELVSGARQAEYGTPLDNWCAVAAIGSVILGKKITFKEALLFMSAAVKTGRELYKEKRDNIIDGCGYLECLDMCYTERDRRIKEGWTFEEATGKWTKPAFDLKKALEDMNPQGGGGCVGGLPYTYPPLKQVDPVFPPPPFPFAPYIGDPLPGQETTITYQMKEVNNG